MGKAPYFWKHPYVELETSRIFVIQVLPNPNSGKKGKEYPWHLAFQKWFVWWAIWWCPSYWTSALGSWLLKVPGIAPLEKPKIVSWKIKGVGFDAFSENKLVLFYRGKRLVFRRVCPERRSLPHRFRQGPSEQATKTRFRWGAGANTWRIIPGLGYVVNNHMVIVSSLRIGLWDPFQIGRTPWLINGGWS